MSFLKSPMMILMVFLIFIMMFGLSLIFGDYFDVLSNYAGKTNIDEVVKACKVQCDNEQKTEFCEVLKEVIYMEGEDVVREEINCFEMVERFWVECDWSCE